MGHRSFGYTSPLGTVVVCSCGWGTSAKSTEQGASVAAAYAEFYTHLKVAQ